MSEEYKRPPFFEIRSFRMKRLALAIGLILAMLITPACAHHTIMECDQPSGGHFKCSYWENG